MTPQEQKAEAQIKEYNFGSSDKELERLVHSMIKSAYLAGYSQHQSECGAGVLQPLLDLLAAHGGTIESTGSLYVYEINQARASNRMYVDGNSLGYVWLPKIDKFPTTVEEVNFLEKWYPLPVELPESLKNTDFLHKKKPSVVEGSPSAGVWLEKIIALFDDDGKVINRYQLGKLILQIRGQFPIDETPLSLESEKDRRIQELEGTIQWVLNNPGSVRVFDELAKSLKKSE